jgi:hypothetical protein
VALEDGVACPSGGQLAQRICLFGSGRELRLRQLESLGHIAQSDSAGMVADLSPRVQQLGNSARNVLSRTSQSLVLIAVGVSLCPIGRAALRFHRLSSLNPRAGHPKFHRLLRLGRDTTC